MSDEMPANTMMRVAALGLACAGLTIQVDDGDDPDALHELAEKVDEINALWTANADSEMLGELYAHASGCLADAIRKHCGGTWVDVVERLELEEME